MKTPLETRGSRANDGKSARLGKKQPDGTHAHRIAHVPHIRPLPPHVHAAPITLGPRPGRRWRAEVGSEVARLGTGGVRHRGGQRRRGEKPGPFGTLTG